MTDVVIPGPYREAWAREENYQAGPRAETRGVVIHTTRGGARPENEYSATIAWFQNPDAAVSAHLVVGLPPFDLTARCVHDDDVAWHAREANKTHLSIEICQPTATHPITDYQYRAAATACRLWAAKYGFPMRRTMSLAVPGIVGHEDTEPGKRDRKSDPGPAFDWPRFVALVQEGTAPDPAPAPAWSLRGELDALWQSAERFEKAGFPWTSQAIKSIVCLRKAEK